MSISLYYLPMGLKQNLQDMDPYDFEELIANLWGKKGYETKVRSKTRDRGVDFEANKTGYKEVVQVKRNSSSNNLGSKLVRNYATLYQQIPTANSVVIVGSGGFTKDAKGLADDLNVTLYTGDDIVNELNEYDVDIDLIDSVQGNSVQEQPAISNQEKRSARQAVKNAIESLQDFHEVNNEFEQRNPTSHGIENTVELKSSINRVRAELNQVNVPEVENNKTVIDSLSGGDSTDFLRLLTSAISLLDEYKKQIKFENKSLRHHHDFQSMSEAREAQNQKQADLQEKIEEYVAITQRFDINGFADEVFE
jgi:hypothetical protein